MGVQGTVENIVCALSEIVGKPCDVNDSFVDGNGNVNRNGNGNGNGNNSSAKRNPIVYLVIVVLFLVLHLLLSKWLWNNILVKLVSVAKPADNVWQLLGLTLLFGLLGGN